MYVNIKDTRDMTPEELAEETMRVLREIIFKLNRELDEIKKIIREIENHGNEET